MNLLIWPERLLFRQEKRSKEKGMDDSDRAQAVMERGSECALCNRLTRKRRAMDAPGRRVCADCGGEIPAARLVAVPDAIRCVNCQNIMEARHVGQHR